MVTRRKLEDALLLLCLAASVEIIISSGLIAFEYYQLLFDKVFERYASLVSPARNAYRICIVYGLTGFVVGVSTFTVGILELKRKKVLKIFRFIVFSGVLVFGIYLVFACYANLSESNNQVLYQQKAITSVFFAISGILATIAPMIVWRMRKTEEVIKSRS